MWSPPDLGTGVEGGSADGAGRQAGGRFGKWMGACWFWRAPKIMGARPHSERAPKIIGARPHSVVGLVISSFSSLQLRVDVF